MPAWPYLLSGAAHEDANSLKESEVLQTDTAFVEIGKEEIRH